MGLFAKSTDKTLEELEQENQKLEIAEQIEKKKYNIAMLKRRLEAKGGKGFAANFKDEKGNFSPRKAFEWLKNH